MKYVLALLLFVSINCHAASILIVGDSESLGYMPYVQQSMAVDHNEGCDLDRDRTTPELGNAGNSKRMSECIGMWLAQGSYTVVHFNAGMHDVYVHACKKGGIAHEIELSDYLMNLQTTLDAIRTYGAIPIFATTTPLDGRVYCHSNDDIKAYNEAAVAMMKSQGVAIDDLNGYIYDVRKQYLPTYDIHFTPAGFQFLSIQVVSFLSSY